ncbi:uncharacterized protein EI90DRAFT_2255884 [Cantharellus anzutake]|uniref:uncharacterized protein n=1 Tax=Cantharellus anzutake TaxID=1750568 RepID=UPI001904A523|nr:uncharacterized protein EI90DRAFT_2255884 [Cantharellus anzutake]KAF8339593.1 hypothetical protein EI90DRAFT_2255884 [Cantharellus anzutake]
MGKFIWHEWARFVSISASIYLLWAGMWGILFRKFFFDFVDHTYTNGTPPLPVPNARYKPILDIIVTIPLIQLFAMVMALGTLAFENPIPPLKNTFAHRNFTFKAVWLLLQATLAILFYQGTNAFLWSIIAAGGYARAVSLGEVVRDENGPRPRGDASAHIRA